MTDPIDASAPSGELPAESSKGFPWRSILEGLAWVSLVAAFVIGQIAAEPDYDSMLKDALPGETLIRSEANESLPFVYQVEGKDDVIIIAAGEGYGGPLVVGVRARRTDDGARLAEAIMLSHKETPAFIERLHRGHFFDQFGGKQVADNFIVDDDIDAVSGATVSARGLTAATRGAVHLGAINHLKLEQTWQQPGWIFGRDEAVLVLLFVLAFIGRLQEGQARQIRGNRRYGGGAGIHWLHGKCIA